MNFSANWDNRRTQEFQYTPIQTLSQVIISISDINPSAKLTNKHWNLFLHDVLEVII